MLMHSICSVPANRPSLLRLILHKESVKPERKDEEANLSPGLASAKAIKPLFILLSSAASLTASRRDSRFQRNPLTVNFVPELLCLEETSSTTRERLPCSKLTEKVPQPRLVDLMVTPLATLLKAARERPLPEEEPVQCNLPTTFNSSFPRPLPSSATCSQRLLGEAAKLALTPTEVAPASRLFNTNCSTHCQGLVSEAPCSRAARVFGDIARRSGRVLLSLSHIILPLPFCNFTSLG